MRLQRLLAILLFCTLVTAVTRLPVRLFPPFGFKELADATLNFDPQLNPQVAVSCANCFWFGSVPLASKSKGFGAVFGGPRATRQMNHQDLGFDRQSHNSKAVSSILSPRNQF